MRYERKREGNQKTTMWTFLHRFASPPFFYRLSADIARWTGWICLGLLVAGLYGGLVAAPPDYQQGDSYRIIFVHVPSAWMSLFIYATMAAAGAVALIWRIKLAEIVTVASAPIGASFTFLALVTGSLWGKPMWGTWWVWDARLTSELILLFLYFGVIGLSMAIEDRRTASRAAGILAVVGVVNIPIVHYSVEWWSTLHQGPTITKFSAPSIHLSMLIPLLSMALAFMLFYITVLMLRMRCELLERERHSRWVRDLVFAPESADMTDIARRA